MLSSLASRLEAYSRGYPNLRLSCVGVEHACPEMRTKARKSWNPFFRALWEYCRAKPFAVEDHPWGDTVFKVGGTRGKIFAFLGQPDADDGGVTVKPSPEELGGLLRLPFVQRAHYIGRYGWIDVSIRDRRSLKLALDLVDETYNRIAVTGKSGATAAGTGACRPHRSRGPTRRRQQTRG